MTPRWLKIPVVLALATSCALPYPALAGGINPAAAAKAASLPDDSGISPEMIDLLADAVIAKLRAKPEILLDVILSYEDKIKSGRSLIQPDDPVSGPENADVTVVEFFDPACLSCRTTGAALDAVTTKDGKVRVVHKDFPTTPDGVNLSLNALGGSSYFEARKAILNDSAPAPADETGRKKAAAILAQDREAGTRAGVKILPTLFFVGGGKAERIEGPATAEAILAKIASVRTRVK